MAGLAGLSHDLAAQRAARGLTESGPGCCNLHGLRVQIVVTIVSKHQPRRVDIQRAGDFVDLARPKAFSILDFLNDGLRRASAFRQLFLRKTKLSASAPESFS